MSAFGTKRTFVCVAVMSAFGGKADIGRAFRNVCFSNRPVGVKRFQAIRHCSVDVARGLALLYGLGARALSPIVLLTERPLKRLFHLVLGSHGSKQTCELTSSLASREGHYSTAWWSSSFLLSHLIPFPTQSGHRHLWPKRPIASGNWTFGLSQR
jgi:hypothetical protein